MKRVTLLDDAAWTWFVQPRAIRTSGDHDRTITGGVTSDGSIVAASYDHETGNITRSTLNSQYNDDDHDCPSFLQRNSDGRIIAFYSMHSTADMRYRVSEEPGDISSWQAEQTISTGNQNTYTYPVQLSGESNRIYLFYRSFPDIGIIWSDDGGATWTAETHLIGPVGHTTYIHVGTNGTDRIDISLSDYLDFQGTHKHVRHCYIQNEAVHGSDGTQLATLSDSEPIIDATTTTMVHDSDSDRTRPQAWTNDISTNGGQPEIVYTTYNSDATRHFYHYATWDGTAWSTHEIVEAGSTIKGSTHYDGSGDKYMPGIVLDKSETGQAYASIGDTDFTTVYEYTTADAGASWTRTQLSHRENENIRPVVPFNLTDGPHSDLPVLWLSGVYDNYKPGSEYDTAVTTGVGEGASQPLQYAMSGTLVTAPKQVGDQATWSAEEWDAAQSRDRVAVVDGHLQLEDYALIDDLTGSLEAYTGATGNYDINSSAPVLYGPTSLKHTAGDDSNDPITSSELDHLPERGDTFSYYFRTDQDADPFALFFYQGSGSHYSVGPNYPNGELEFRKDTLGTDGTLDATAVAWDASQWYEILTATNTDGTLTGTAYEVTADRERRAELGTVSVTDTAYDTGAFGFYASRNGTATCDFPVNRSA